VYTITMPTNIMTCKTFLIQKREVLCTQQEKCKAQLTLDSLIIDTTGTS